MPPAASAWRGQTLDGLERGRITIDGRPLQGASAVRGIGSYLRGLLGGFSELDVTPRIRLLLSAGAIPREVEDLRLTVAERHLPTVHATLQPTLDLYLVARALRRERPLLFHTVEWGQPLRAPCPVVVTIHDLIPFVFPRDYPWVRRARILPLRALRRADRVVAVSASTARDVQRITHVDPERISVVHEGVSSAFQPATADVIAAARKRLRLDGPFVLAVGTFDPRKRIRLLADVTRRIRRRADVDLVIAGDQGTFGSRVQAAVGEAGIESRTHVTGHVSMEELIALYTATSCFLFTSAYEGFGLPPLEAMACGAPVVMFDNSSLPEVAGSAAMLVPDGDAEAMAETACRVIENHDEQARRRAAGQAWASQFTWRRSAELTLAAYDRALGG